MAETPSQLLSLKVMRVSRPALATAWEPFYSSSSSFSAHSTASIMSLQGKNPLPGHPKTLRDLTHISDVLTLPSAFGAIQLGETFSSCLAVNNEVSQTIQGVTLRVEMQTATTKTLLAEHTDIQLAAGEILEKVIHHEIKELGQHVLACTVSYLLPAGHHPSRAAGDQDIQVQSFRKFYKFAVTNPLSVKTKVHVPRSPTAILSKTEREKVFLEVHIQNLTPEALWLERMRFEPADGWGVMDANLAAGSSDPPEAVTIFSGSMALLQPQDTRQYVYILAPKVIPDFPVVHPPGSIISLGRLDISWRSAFGEPGRLLTSMLSRRIPLIQAPQVPSVSQPPPLPPKLPPSALPLHLQRSNTMGSATPPRVGSPQLQRPLSPPISGPAPYRSNSPFRARTSLLSLAASPQTPNFPPPPPSNAVRRPDETVDADLVVDHLPRDELVVERPFKITFTVTLSAPAPPTPAGSPPKERLVTLAIQHVLPARDAPRVTALVSPLPAPVEPWSPKLPSSGFSTPSPYGTPTRGDFSDTLAQRLLDMSPREALIDTTIDAGAEADGQDTGQATPAPPAPRDEPPTVVLPPPYAVAEPGNASRVQPKDVAFLGSSAVILPQMRVPVPVIELSGREHGHERNISQSTTDSETDDELSETIVGKLAPRMLMSQDFELEFLPMRAGFAAVGGLRVLLVEDRVVGADGENSRTRRPADVRTLREWDVVAELWVKTAASPTT